ncbi:MAG: T9SS type A sorting domain-containing protein [Arcicella sp.]|jgi:hypothetical protein|nr:T9SS type A sorting domain-containing protein [Arcicella sp.]
MRKLTLVFATLLAMFEISFGQKNAKVLWEKVVDSSAVIDAKWANYLVSPAISPNGNILVQYRYSSNNTGRDVFGVKTYDTKGKKMWDAKDFYNRSYSLFETNLQSANHMRVNSFYFEPNDGSFNYDSTLYFDKNYKFLRKIQVLDNRAFIAPVEDGLLHSTAFEKATIKYNLEGKEEWRYAAENPIVFQTQSKPKSPYFGLITLNSNTRESQYVIIDKEGKEKGKTAPSTFNQIFPTNDNGFWSSTSYDYKISRYVKYDSTAKETTNFSLSNIVPFNSSNSFISKVTPDNAMVLAYLDSNYEVNIIKIDSKGNTTKIVKNVGIKADLDKNTLDGKPYSIKIDDIKITDKGEILYGIYYHYFYAQSGIATYSLHKQIIGAEIINNSNFSWFKEVAASTAGANKIDFYSGNDDIIQISSPYYTTRAGLIDGRAVSYYDTEGKPKWGYSKNFTKEVLRIGNKVFFSVEQNVFGVDRTLVILNYETGKVIKEKSDCLVNSIKDDIKIDSSGNIYVLNSFTDGTQKSKRISIFKSDGTDLNEYVKSSMDKFQLAENKSMVITFFEQIPNSNNVKYILRKVAFCEDLVPTAIASATEVCPTEKIKLSTTKQEGVTYQWQKNGNDIPALRDAVHDINESGTYRVVIKDEFCQNTAISNELKVIVRSLPTAEIKGVQAAICVGDKSMLTAQTNGTFFQWQRDERDINNATGSVYEASESGNYRVSVRDDKCPQRGFSNTYSISVKSLPEATISTDIKRVIYEPLSVKMFANAGTELSYQWFKNDTLINNAISEVYEAKKSGKYAVSVTKDGCAKLSDALQISILFPLANQSEINEEAVQVYPNPSRGAFNVILPKSFQNADIQLFDLLGRERTLTYTGEEVRAEGLMQGTYFLKVTKGEKSVTNKIVVE